MGAACWRDGMLLAREKLPRQNTCVKYGRQVNLQLRQLLFRPGHTCDMSNMSYIRAWPCGMCRDTIPGLVFHSERFLCSQRLELCRRHSTRKRQVYSHNIPANVPIAHPPKGSSVSLYSANPHCRVGHTVTKAAASPPLMWLAGYVHVPCTWGRHSCRPPC